jgi:membrane-associated protein
MFLTIFFETGIVVTPFLPGDTLLFTAGALAGAGKLNIYLLFVLLTTAAILGDSLNYLIGEKFSEGILRRNWVRKKHLDKTHSLYKKHGGKIIIFARFLPIVRTVAPFVAGAGKMNYKDFFRFNVVGALVWVILFLVAGYFFGNLKFVQENFSLVIIIIILAFSGFPFLFKKRRS